MYTNKTFKKFFLTAIFFVIAVSPSFAQENLKEKISKIDADVEKITITAGGEEYTFEGKDAEKLFKKMKSHKKSKFFSIKMDEENIDEDNKIIIKSLGKGDECYDIRHHGDKHLIWFGDEDGSEKKKIKIITDGNEEVYEFKHGEHGDISWFGKGKNGMAKRMEIEIKDGVKKVTVTTNENGEEKAEVYEGEEADKYLEEMKSEHGNEILIEIDEDCNHKKLKKIYIEKEIKKEDSDK